MHGEYHHFAPESSYIGLENDMQISAKELALINPTNGDRRLIILDVCDGSTAGVSTDFLGVGIGPSVGNKYQSLISYLWPIENIQSLILGLILGTFIGNSSSYCVAHHQTISLFFEGKSSVLSHLQQYCTNIDVLERVANVEFDFKNFYYWGALNYMR